MEISCTGSNAFPHSRPDAGLRESGLEKQNVMRLRINRIALIQELRVEHVLRSLIEAGILNEDDLKQITSGSTPADKARVLVDMLPGMYVVCIPKSVGLELSDKKVKVAACQDFCPENVCSLYLLYKFKCTTEYFYHGNKHYEP